MHWSKLLAISILPPVLMFLLGRVMIPIFRKYRTGKFDIYIGDRFKTDGSEPSFGGVCALAVFLPALMLAASAVGRTEELVCAAVFTAAITAAGVFDDCMTELYGKPYGLKSGVKLGYIYSACFLTLLVLDGRGLVKTEILLPFRLGYVNMGLAYFPVTALVMTGVIYAFSYHNRFGVDEDSCIGGLCAVTAFIVGAGVTVSGNILSDTSSEVYGVYDVYSAYGAALSSVAMGSLVWGLSPSKLRYGASGGYFFGAAAVAALVICPYVMIGVLFSSVGAIADSICSAVQYTVYIKTKKLLLKGSSLHGHLKAKGMTDYKIIIIFFITAALGCAAQIAFAVYACRLRV